MVPHAPTSAPTSAPAITASGSSAVAGTVAGTTASAASAPRRRRRPAPPVEPLGSLLAPGVALSTCPACGKGQLTELSMVLTDGTAVRFTSCRGCEHRRWETAGETLSISDVLERSRA